MRILPVLFILTLLTSGKSLAGEDARVPVPGDSIILTCSEISYNPEYGHFDDSLKMKLSLRDAIWMKVSSLFPTASKDKLTAIVLSILTGPLGGHRIFLGTKPLVPVFYVLTLGGGLGVLPFIDFVILCFAQDITPYENNPKFFMWAQ